MLKTNKYTVGRNIRMGLCLMAVTLVTSCAKLPMENDAPGAPVLYSDGEYQPGGVEVRVTVDDPDGDMVSLHFQTISSSHIINDFIWTSFVDSGEEAFFYLNIGTGQYSLTAQAKDELEELSVVTSYDLLVTMP